MSKARYSMGNKAVTALQYPSDMEAITRVVIDPSKDSNYEEFRVLRSNISDRIDDKKTKNGEEIKSTVRRRKGESGDKTTVDKLAQDLDKMKMSKKEEKANQIGNPLNWFGVLVPPCLRSAQKDFEKAINICVEMASLQQEIHWLIDNFRSTRSQAECNLDNNELADVTTEKLQENEENTTTPQEIGCNT
ncbi:uncharacterized protein TRIADDRAFT_55299 [Trichoplax adhaerens]|uniref:Vacuolar ATPase assembly protein VMA22 n=1 Tax=Trichoplax adhaerens TaxID=10228 RepID=B3RUI2_TRIAD|nr:hypothetical protein TRIADDRAFT_55299 [Trichoplax adhaerens]EDV25817.1 hypothetical protein TRIADDRAFT_55299 [Trichoplax adhaerens]|eukprot:XP_002111850.1 hypothetical protein TRIADDRAFT_55299 [Trichoplax adhaerens]